MRSDPPTVMDDPSGGAYYYYNSSSGGTISILVISIRYCASDVPGRLIYRAADATRDFL